MSIRNLVFEGGGVKGAAYAGALQALAAADIYADTRRLAGASAGSITASVLATGGGPEGLMTSVRNTNFHEFIFDHGGIVGDVTRVARHYGLHTGDRFVEILCALIDSFSGNPDLTFAELERKHESQPDKFKSLSIVASNLTRQCAQVFNVESHPDLPIWKAVRCSISIPVVFEPYEIDGEYFVDGGLSWNYPIDMFDTGTHRNPETLGFFLEDHQAVSQGPAFRRQKLEINSLSTFVQGVSAFMYETANRNHIHPDDKPRTVFIDDLSVSGADFNTSEDKLLGLIDSGRKSTEDYLATHVP